MGKFNFKWFIVFVEMIVYFPFRYFVINGMSIMQYA